MSALDWFVLVGTIATIVAYGAWKTRGAQDIQSYLKGGNELKWPTIGLSVMATQASAITFLSTPGLAYEDGMRFVQFYFGLPLAMVVICAVFIPIYYRLNVFTAYEYLEFRFDARVRYLGATLFLVQRGLAAGITIYAPAIILSTLMGWPLQGTILAIGIAVILYTVSGGTKAVSQTQKHQMIVMMSGMIVAAVVIGVQLSETISLPHAVKVAGALGRMNIVDFKFDFNDRYNFWSGITGGFFLALSYFGTDQSQVQRYLTGRSATESRLGLLFNGLFKIPMQALILFIGVLVFVFYVFVQPPIFFNGPALEAARASARGSEIVALEERFAEAHQARKAAAHRYVESLEAGREDAKAKADLREADQRMASQQRALKAVLVEAVPDAETKDGDYVFVSFVLEYLPSGLIGLLIAVIMSAAMSSTASELNALGSTTVIDLYRRRFVPNASAQHSLTASKVFTALWGLVALGFASFASLLDNLIEAVNILGSIFYGTVLGLFLVAFFLKRVTATPVLVGAAIAQATVVFLFFESSIGYLWYNVIGCGIVLVASALVQALLGTRKAT